MLEGYTVNGATDTVLVEALVGQQIELGFKGTYSTSLNDSDSDAKLDLNVILLEAETLQLSSSNHIKFGNDVANSVPRFGKHPKILSVKIFANREQDLVRNIHPLDSLAWSSSKSSALWRISRTRGGLGGCGSWSQAKLTQATHMCLHRV